MILRTSIVLLSVFVFVELCLRTIPPEDVFISSTGANLPTDDPETEEPEEPIDAPVTNAPVTDAPVTDVTDVTDAPVTNAPTELCTTCDIDDIAPELMEPGATSFTSTETAAAGECKKTTVVCQRTDAKICDSVTMSAQSASGSNSVADSSTSNSVTSQLTCSEDGTYSWNAVTGITKLSCDFVNCIDPLPCATCDVNKIAPTMPLPAGQVFEATETTGPGGCKGATVKCGRSDGQTCTKVSIEAQGTGGSATLSETMDSNEAEASLSCQNDGTYAASIAGGITSLTCVYDGCSLPCTKCDITTISPPMPMPTGTNFVFTELAATGACKQTQVTCQRTDDMLCDVVLLAVALDIATSLKSKEVSTVLECQADGTYSHPTAMISGITSLSCGFSNCVLPCATCDLSKIAPPTPYPPGTGFETQDIASPGSCTTTTVACTRTDGRVCTSNALLADGAEIVASNTDWTEAEIVCQSNGKYTSSLGGDISQLTCKFDCPATCTECDITSIAPPMPYPAGVNFLATEIPVGPGSCKQTQVKCQRTDDQICDVVLLAGNIDIAKSPKSKEASAFLVCQGGGTYSYAQAMVSAISSLSCRFDNCENACNTCDINLIAPPMPMPPGTSFEASDDEFNGCKTTTVGCTRFDGQLCTSIALLADGQEIGSSGGTVVRADLDCKNNRKYSQLGGPDISQLTCVFDGCAPVCPIPACLPPIVTKAIPEIEVSITEVPQPNGCIIQKVTCSVPGASDCLFSIIQGVGDAGTNEVLSTELTYNTVTAYLECRSDGKFNSNGVTGISSVLCNLLCL